jgi:microcystin-dependent protein
MYEVDKKVMKKLDKLSSEHFIQAIMTSWPDFFHPNGWLFTSGSFLKISEVVHIFGAIFING